MPTAFFPKRVICLTEETTETLYAIGADDLIVGISGFTVRPKIARRTKPKVSTYLDANIQQIIDLQPDIVFAWSDLQASLCADLIREGIEVVCFNHRSIDGILSMILRLGAIVGKSRESEKYIQLLMRNLHTISCRATKLKRLPRVYFEEWYDPIITGICWVSELIELCGGVDIFAENRVFPDAKRRIIADQSEIIRRSPDIMIASWCGKMFKPTKVLERNGWAVIPAIKYNQMHEIHSSIILQPGPASLTEGANSMIAIFEKWSNSD